MNRKKTISLISTICMSLNCCLVPVVNAETENLSFPMSYSFENDFEGWMLDTSKGEASLERITENDNSFLRLTAKAGEVYRANDKIEVIPNGYMELENPYIMKADSEVIISLDMRTNNNKFARNIYLNRDQLNETVRSEVQYNFATLWNWKKDNSVSVFDGVTTQSVGGYPKTKSTTVFEDVLENDKWYNFKTILFTDENGLPEYIELSVSDNGEVNLISEKKEIKNQTLRLSDKITRLDFAMGNAGVTLSEDATFDIDNVKIYTETDDRFWKIKSDNDGNVFGDVDTITLLFSGEMEKESLNPQNVKVYDSGKNEISYKGEYNEKDLEYYITPDEKITNGEYTVFVDTENVNGLRSDLSVIHGMADECEQKISFVVFSGDLPEVRNLEVSGKNIPNGKLTATGEFYQENGLEGYLKYQWWYGDEENADFTRIENATTDSFMVIEGFYDKFIKVSVIPVSNDNVIRGEEVFSNTILPPAKPIVKNLKVTGKNAKGESLKAVGEYYQEDGLSGSVKYQWWYSSNSDGVYSKIDNETSDILKVTEDFSDKYIKVSAIAVSDLIGQGEEVFGDVIYPQVKPYAYNVKISGIAVEGMEASIDYTFADDNGDDEGESVFEWFISDTGTGNWEKLEGEISDSYTIKNADIGKFLKAQVTPVAKEKPYVGSTVQSNVFGPVTSFDSINLVKNSGFEDGTNTGWNVNRMGGDDAKVEATKMDAYSGEWSGRFSGQTQNSTFMTYGVKLQGNIRYLETCMMKVAPESSVDNVNIVFYGEGNPKITYEYMEQAVINKSDWTRVSQVISVENDGTFSEMPQFWANGTTGYVSYIDDFYMAPLLIKDISAEVPERINIPTSGEISSDIEIFGIFNQIGTSLGLEEEEAYWKIDSGVKGVYVKDNKLYVTSDAVSGTLNLKAVCEPQFDGAVQTKFTKNYQIELVTNDNKTPRINSIKLLGDTSEKSSLNLEYDFYQVDGCEDQSDIKWYVSDSLSGEYKEVSGDGKNFNITDEYLNCYIKAEVTPKDSEGRIGQVAVSNIAGPKTAPVAENVSIRGKGFVGDVIKSQYTYYDFNGDREGITKFQWMRAESENGEYKEISGETETEYTIKSDDIDCWIKLRITPVSEKEPFMGESVLSDAIKGPRAPRAENVTVSVSGKVLTGKYKYVNDNGVDEGNTICEWLIDGKVVGTGTRYEADFSGTKTVEFKVTPVALKEPCEGESISVTNKVTGKSSGGSGGGSGGGTGGTSLPGALQSSMAQNTIIPQFKAKNDDVSIKDISGHWAESYAKKVVEKNIMRIDSNNNFYPDKKVTRAEMIEYVFKAMNFTETEYRNEFSDVSSDLHYAKMLQTMVDKGIISKDVNFRPNDNVSRQEVCKILSIALGLLNSEFDLSKYSDNTLIGDWAIPYVKNIINSNLMVGVSETVFSPRTDITNGQIAKIVIMMIEGNYNK